MCPEFPERRVPYIAKKKSQLGFLGTAKRGVGLSRIFDRLSIPYEYKRCADSFFEHDSVEGILIERVLASSENFKKVQPSSLCHNAFCDLDLCSNPD